MRHLGRVLLVAACLLVGIGPVSAQTQITDATVDELLQRAEDAYRRGRADETAALLHRTSDWANHIRDGASGSAKPAEDLAFAERIYRRVLATFGRTLGADHDHAGSALVGLASLYIDQQRYAEAEPLLRRTLGIAESAPAPSDDHRQAVVARVVGQLGQLEERQGRNAEAEAHYRRALAIVDKLPPRFRNATGKCVQHYLRFLRANNRPQEAAAIEARLTR
jgi:tetratricopeptide (TPR) repeat protein